MAHLSDFLTHRKPAEVAIAIFLIPVLLALTKVVYNIYFHPLSKYPGPKLYAATSIPFSIAQLRGQWHSFVLSAHEQYGPVVRVSPNQLYFITSKAWGDIYARRGGAGPLPKDPNFWKTTVDPQSMVMANDTEHARIRRIMSPGFSQRSILQQEYLIQANVDILLSQLQKRVEQGIRSDLREWYSYVTFDILGDLAFGESFHCLQSTQFHGWVQMILDFFYGSVLAHVVYRFRPLDRLLGLLLPISIPDEKENRNRMALETIKRRVQSTIERPDFISYMLEGVKAEQMTLKELEEQASVILMAGSDTSSITLTYATFYIAANPQVLENLRTELMRTFKNEQEISILGINQLQYLHAVVQEVLRMSTPVPNGFQRQVSKGGAVIDGKFVPEKAVVSISHYAAYMSKSNFIRPEEFRPERWLGDKHFDGDRRDIFQPFSVGPRNCIGQKFAYDTIKLILSRIIWRFDMELDDPTKAEWVKPRLSYLSWRPPPLHVTLKVRKQPT